MEKSLLSFATTYPGWAPGAAAKHLLTALRPLPPPQLVDAAPAASGSVQWASVVTAHHQPHYPFTTHLSDSLNNTGAPFLPWPCFRSCVSQLAGAAVTSRLQQHA